MYNGKKIIFVITTDNQSKLVCEFSNRIWDQEKFIKKLLNEKTCIIGRKTQEITEWKGKNTWIITKNKKWKRKDVGVISNLEDLDLILNEENEIIILGGFSIFYQLKEFVDEIHMFSFNFAINTNNELPYLFNLFEWFPIDYRNESLWSYAHLKRKVKDNQHKNKLF